jgi:hypothetical protein
MNHLQDSLISTLDMMDNLPSEDTIRQWLCGYFSLVAPDRARVSEVPSFLKRDVAPYLYHIEFDKYLISLEVIPNVPNYLSVTREISQLLA